MERGYQVPTQREKIAFLLEKDMHTSGMLQILEMAKKLRADGKEVLIVNMKKNKKFQKEQLQEQGYTQMKEFYKDSVES
jgi:histidyl-tRNA synthetase